jgi:hypothetical protein
LNALETARRFNLIEQLWTSIARLTRAEFFYQRPAATAVTTPGWMNSRTTL